MFENVRIKERLTKAFVMVAAITAIGAVVGLAAMLVMSNRYSSALVNYGFSQGDIGKAMITFANTRSATRGIIGFDEQGLLDDAMTEHDEQKAKFENYFATVGDVVTTSEEKALYQRFQINCSNTGQRRNRSSSRVQPPMLHSPQRHSSR